MYVSGQQHHFHLDSNPIFITHGLTPNILQNMVMSQKSLVVTDADQTNMNIVMDADPVHRRLLIPTVMDDVTNVPKAVIDTGADDVAPVPAPVIGTMTIDVTPAPVANIHIPIASG